MIAVDCQSYSIVEDVGFLRLMKRNWNQIISCQAESTFLRRLYHSFMDQCLRKWELLLMKQSISVSPLIFGQATVILLLLVYLLTVLICYWTKDCCTKKRPFPGSHTAARITGPSRYIARIQHTSLRSASLHKRQWCQHSKGRWRNRVSKFVMLSAHLTTCDTQQHSLSEQRLAKRHHCTMQTDC